VLCSALELQSRAIVPGSIRLVFAIIYSLFLGYGITVGTAIYGAIDSNATNSTQCDAPLNSYWNFLFVPLYVFFTTFTVQAKYKQMPAMIFIATAGYTVNFFANMKFSSSAPIAVRPLHTKREIMRWLCTPPFSTLLEHSPSVF
jgi:uncharacterized membrane protein YjjB (DUF3815 family)